MKAAAWLKAPVLLAAVSLTGCGLPMNYLVTSGQPADVLMRLAWGMGGVSLAVVAIVSVLLVWGLLRKRSQPDASGRPAVSADSSGLSWIVVGVGISTVVLALCTVWTFLALRHTADPPREPGLEITVVANQWWWEIKYPATDTGPAVTTANELHIPVGVPVLVRLRSTDVIHSFWVPQLAGKTDVIPGQVNSTWLLADAPGTYRGQCGEYCGAQHAHMAFYVIAQPPEQFEAWRRHMAQPTEPPEEALAKQGQTVFQGHCGICHTVRGTRAAGKLGPDLTHLMTRNTIGAGMLPNNTGYLAGWVANAQAFKPGVLMPRLTLAPEELLAVVAYLESLE